MIGREAGDERPYVGPVPYGFHDATKFFGRARVAAEIHDLWEATQLVVLYGPRGSGKTSLLRAGVLPRVDLGDAHLLPVGRVARGAGGVTPDQGWGNVHVFSLLSHWFPDERPADLSGATLTAFLHDIPARYGSDGDPLTVLAAIDQFEELYTAYPSRWPERADFMEQLLSSLSDHPQLHVLLLLREEHLADLLADEARLVQFGQRRRRLPPLQQNEAFQAITGPLGRTQRFFAPGEALRLAHDLASISLPDGMGTEVQVTGQFVDPLRLQIVCSATWTGLARDLHQIEVPHIPPLSRLRDELAAWYRRMVAEVAAQLGMPVDTLFSWVASTFVEEARRTRTAWEGPATTRGMPNEVVRALRSRQVLTEERHLGGRWYGLGSDRFAEAALRAAPRRDQALVRYRHLAAAEDAWVQGALAAARHRCRLGLQTPSEAGVHIDLLALLGHMCFVDGALTEAAGHLEQALAHAHTIGDVQRIGGLSADLGRAFRQAGDMEGTLAVLHRAIALDIDDPRLLREFGGSLQATGRYEDALRAYGRSLQMEPASYDVRLAHADVLIDLGRYEEALDSSKLAADLADSPSSLVRARAVAKLAGERLSQMS
ncbi:hypothetical protein GCM10022226_15560 [Sphaerisporangium flaviroseum]|uniref:Novel STAND NTPase 1 domain-containing protein n=1 Tax=Sphaerisporangium flaviroseum TaxID=509199 RepID=A0ABP7HLJ7_9ACTN